jgi:hypothetical protein
MLGAPSFAFFAKGGRPRTSTRPLFASALFALLTLLTGCKPVGPNYNRPGYTAPAGLQGDRRIHGHAAAQPGRRRWQPAPPTACCAANGGRSTRTRSSTSSKNASPPTTRPCVRRWKPTSPRATRSSVARAALFPTLSAGPSARATTSQQWSLLLGRQAHDYNDFSLTGQASWEPDFWGRIRRTVEAATRTRRPAPPIWPTST